MNRPPGSSGVQWLNRRDMSFRTEDSITLCQRALQIVTELCLTGHVDREKCSDIFPLESHIPGKGHAGKWFKVIIFSSLIPAMNHFRLLPLNEREHELSLSSELYCTTFIISFIVRNCCGSVSLPVTHLAAAQTDETATGRKQTI